MNESGVDVMRSMCHNVSAELVIDSNNLPLGNDRVAVQIAESLLEEEVSSEWMFSMRAWHLCRVFLNGASFYDHEQQHIYSAAVQALNHQPRKGVWQYDSERRKQESANSLKKVLKLSTQSIYSISSIVYCKKNCV